MYIKRFVLFGIVVSVVLAGCARSKPVTVPSSMPTQVAATDLPSVQYQLTYIESFISSDREYQGIFASDVQCLDQKTPCFGSPELLLKIPKQPSTDPQAPYGEIINYGWSPDGKKIAFSAYGIDERLDVFVSDWNGENTKNITMSSADEIFPSWSVDNQLIYTVCDGRCHAVTTDEDGRNATVFPFRSRVDFASWMPEAKQVLFIGADDKSNYQIYIANIDGSNVQQVTQTFENDIVPYASTNGKLIFFTRSQTYIDNNFNSNIFSIDRDRRMENAITMDKELLSFHPSAAPFGDWLAFEQGRDSYNIYVTSFDGEQILQVANGEGDRGVPEWRIVSNP